MIAHSIVKFKHLAALAVLPFLAAPVAAASESEWIEHQFAKSRIVASHQAISVDADALLYLGWEVTLPPGWKTYWRTPGDAGRPASFDWQGSTNLKAAEILYPRPDRFEIFGLQTFGYEGTVLIPIRLYPEHTGLPIKVELNTWFMACQDICVPIEASYTLEFPTADAVQPSIHAARIHGQLAKVPEKAFSNSTALRLSDARVRGQAGHQRLTILIAGEHLLSGADVIVEAGEEFRLGPPQKVLLNDGRSARFVFPIGSYLDSADLKGKSSIVTISDGWGLSIEKRISFDTRGRMVETLAKSD